MVFLSDLEGRTVYITNSVIKKMVKTWSHFNSISGRRKKILLLEFSLLNSNLSLYKS